MDAFVVLDIGFEDGDTMEGALLGWKAGSITLLDSSHSSSSTLSKSGKSSEDDGEIESGEDVVGVFLRRRFCASSAEGPDTDADVRLVTPLDLITGESLVASWNELEVSGSENSNARTDFMVKVVLES